MHFFGGKICIVVRMGVFVPIFCQTNVIAYSSFFGVAKSGANGDVIFEKGGVVLGG